MTNSRFTRCLALLILLQACASGGLQTHNGTRIDVTVVGCYTLHLGPWSRSISDAFPEHIELFADRVEPLGVSPFVFKMQPPLDPSSSDAFEYRFVRRDGQPDHLGLERGGHWWITPSRDTLVLLYGHPHWGTAVWLALHPDTLRGNAVVYDHSSRELPTAPVVAWAASCPLH